MAARRRVRIEITPHEARRGDAVNVAIRSSALTHLWLSITAEPSGVRVFAPLRVTLRPARRRDLTIGTRFFRGGSYVVRASPRPDMRLAAITRLAILPRSLVPLAALLPILLGRPAGRKGAPRAVEEGRPIQPPPRPPAPPTVRGPATPRGPPGRRRPDAGARKVRDRPLSWPTDEPWPGAKAPRVQDPWATGTYYTRAQVESVLRREREKRKKRPWLKPLPEGTVEDVMLQLAKDKAASDRVQEHYDLTRPVSRYVFVTERDERVCWRCRELDAREWVPWVWRPPIPVHPNCRCHYERSWRG